MTTDTVVDDTDIHPAAKPALDLSQVRRFLEAAYPPGLVGRLHVSSIDPERSKAAWAGKAFARDDLDSLLGHIAKLDARGDLGIYLRVTTNRPGTRGRGAARSSLEFVGMWSDIDIAGPGHKFKPRKDGLVLPPDEDGARAIVDASGLPKPTVWIHSGGGMYAWWLLEEPIRFPDAEAFDWFGALSRRWHKALERGARTLGYHYGTAVSDLARVMRVPGTVNRKVEDDPRPCRLLSDDGPRHTVDNVSAVLETLEAQIESGRRQVPQRSAALREPTARVEGPTPLNAFEEAVDWADILLPEGWQLHSIDPDGTRYWTRPGKSTAEGISATSDRPGTDRSRLYIFSDAAGFENDDLNTPLTKGYVYAHYRHGGDLKAAARALLAMGYGSTKAPKSGKWIADESPIKTSAPRDSKPRVNVSNEALAADWLVDAIGYGRLAGLFERGGEIVYVPCETDKGYVPLVRKDDPTRPQNHDGPAQVRVADANKLAALVDNEFDLFKIKENRRTGETEEAPALFPQKAAVRVAVMPERMPNLRHLRGVTHTPMVRSDGTILDTPGYDDRSGIYFMPDHGLDAAPVPDRPTPRDIRDAVALLDYMTSGFDFVLDAHRANFYGMLITPLLRELVPCTYKMFILDAPMRGSGKSLLADIAMILHGGVKRAELPERDDELRKSVTAILDTTTAPVVCFDNVTGVLRSSTLAGLLTTRPWHDRRLGTGEQISLVNDRLWITTGNNVTVGGDIARRTLWVTIDPNTPRPEDRTDFEIEDLPSWVREHRAELLRALLVLIRAWVVAGRPQERTSSDSFAPWTAAVSGILANAGVRGQFGDKESARGGDGTDDDGWGEFLAKLYEVFGDSPFEVGDILPLLPQGRYEVRIEGTPEPRLKFDDLPSTDLAERAEQQRPIARSLGMFFVHRDGRFSGEYVARLAGPRGTKSKKSKKWRIEHRPMTPQLAEVS